MTFALGTGPEPVQSPDRFDDVQWLTRLAQAHNAELPRLHSLLRYYNGQQPLTYMHPELVGLIGERVRQLVINWPRIVVDSLEERIDWKGFRFPDEAHRDEDLARIFEYNHLDAGYQMAHTTAMITGRAYVVVGPNPRPSEAEFPLVTVESPLHMHVELDPGTKQVVAAVKRWSDNPVLAGGSTSLHYATLFRRNHTVTYLQDGGDWVEVSRNDHNLGRVPVEPIVNRPQLWSPLGMSELDDVIPISDAVCKIATDMMVSAEFHAMPRRWALGFDDDDFKDAQGKFISAWRTVAGVLWSSPKTYQDDGAQLGQFQESDLTNFHNTLRALAVQVAAVSGLPMHMLGYSSDNPASAAGINAAADRHIKRAERRLRGYEQGWENVARLIYLVRDGQENPDARWIESEWADTATPTFALKADGITKLYATDRLVPRRTARRSLGYTSGQIVDMEREDREDVMRVEQFPEDATGPHPQDTSDADSDNNGT